MSQITLGQGRELVEQRLDNGGVEDDHDELEGDHEGHEPWYETVAGPLEDFEEDGEERSAEDQGDCPGLEEVGDEDIRGGLVEAVLLFKYKGTIPREWQRWDCRQEVENEDKRDGLENLNSK